MRFIVALFLASLLCFIHVVRNVNDHPFVCYYLTLVGSGFLILAVVLTLCNM